MSPLQEAVAATFASDGTLAWARWPSLSPPEKLSSSSPTPTFSRVGMAMKDSTNATTPSKKRPVWRLGPVNTNREDHPRRAQS